jgi:hypothetical protein
MDLETQETPRICNEWKTDENGVHIATMPKMVREIIEDTRSATGKAVKPHNTRSATLEKNPRSTW